MTNMGPGHKYIYNYNYNNFNNNKAYGATVIPGVAWYYTYGVGQRYSIDEATKFVASYQSSIYMCYAHISLPLYTR